jgi:transcriptional regulator with XRE-family HTH domain
LFGDLVRVHRRRLGLTQDELAGRAGVGVRSIRGIEAVSTFAGFALVVAEVTSVLSVGTAARRVTPCPMWLGPWLAGRANSARSSAG